MSYSKSTRLKSLLRHKTKSYGMIQLEQWTKVVCETHLLEYAEPALDTSPMDGLFTCIRRKGENRRIYRGRTIYGNDLSSYSPNVGPLPSLSLKKALYK